MKGLLRDYYGDYIKGNVILYRRPPKFLTSVFANKL